MALETQTMTIMPDMVLDGTGLEYYGLIVHELAHQWFGNTLTLGNWSDIWLNEGFATYMDWMSREARFGLDAALAVRSASEQTLITDGRVSPLIDPAPAEMFGIATYDKGAWVLHMLRQEIGDEAFVAVLRAYYDTARLDRPTDTLTFWQIAEATTGRDLSAFFTQWLLQGGIPRYTLYWTERGSGADVLLCPTAAGDYRLSLTLRFTANGSTQNTVLNVKESSARAGFPLDFAPTSLTVDPNQAVLAQVQVQPIAELPAACPAVD
jgi:aminopeptidase N